MYQFKKTATAFHALLATYWKLRLLFSRNILDNSNTVLIFNGKYDGKIIEM